MLLSGSGNHLRWLPFPVPIAIAAAEVALAARSLRRWSARTDLQLLAVCSGALSVQMAAGFGVTGLDGLVNIIGKAILNAIAVCLLAWFWLRLRRRHDTPVARPPVAPHGSAVGGRPPRNITVTKPEAARAARSRGPGPDNTRHQTRGLGELTEANRPTTRGSPASLEEA